MTQNAARGAEQVPVPPTRYPDLHVMLRMLLAAPALLLILSAYTAVPLLVDSVVNAPRPAAAGGGLPLKRQ